MQLDGPPAVEPITSHSNARLKHARKLQARRHRRLLGQFLAEGEDIVEEALAAGILPVETLIAADRPPDEGLVARLARGGPVLAVRDALLAEVGGLGHPARVIGLYDIASLPREYPGSDPAYAPLGVYLDHVIDPGNVGTVVRACGALGPARLAALARVLRPARGQGRAGLDGRGVPRAHRDRRRRFRTAACGLRSSPGRRRRSGRST